MRSATRPVQPVWCDAPSPAPVSPWKYSWKGISPCQAGSVWNARRRRRPAGARRRVEEERRPAGRRGRRRPRSSVGLAARSGRVLDGEVLAEVAGEAAQRLDHEVVDGEPDGPRQLELPPNSPVVDSARLVVDASPIMSPCISRTKGWSRWLAASGPQAVRREELLLVEHHGQDPRRRGRGRRPRAAGPRPCPRTWVLAMVRRTRGRLSREPSKCSANTGAARASPCRAWSWRTAGSGRPSSGPAAGCARRRRLRRRRRRSRRPRPTGPASFIAAAM